MHGMRTTTVKQGDMTGECWLVQFWGDDACKTCEARDTSECGGQQIRKTGKNEKGHTVPLSQVKGE